MAVFRLQLRNGPDRVVEADVAGRTHEGAVVLEAQDPRHGWVRVDEYPAADVTAVYRRGPVDGGANSWIPQPVSGSWWCY